MSQCIDLKEEDEVIDGMSSAFLKELIASGTINYKGIKYRVKHYILEPVD